MRGVLLLIRKSQRLSAQDGKVYCDWRHRLPCPRLLWETGGSLPVPPSFTVPHLTVPRETLPSLLRFLEMQNVPKQASASACGPHPDLSEWVSGRGSSWEEQLPMTGSHSCQAQSMLIERDVPDWGGSV